MIVAASCWSSKHSANSSFSALHDVTLTLPVIAVRSTASPSVPSFTHLVSISEYGVNETSKSVDVAASATADSKEKIFKEIDCEWAQS